MQSNAFDLNRKCERTIGRQKMNYENTWRLEESELVEQAEEEEEDERRMILIRISIKLKRTYDQVAVRRVSVGSSGSKAIIVEMRLSQRDKSAKVDTDASVSLGCFG
jgi:hypothetical protein